MWPPHHPWRQYLCQRWFKCSRNRWRGPYIGCGIIITLYDGKLTAYGGKNGAGIGGGYYLSGGELTIYGGEVYAHGCKAAAGIGSGNVESQKDRHGGALNIHGGSVNAWGGDYGAGIGGGENSNGSKVTRSGGSV